MKKYSFYLFIFLIPFLNSCTSYIPISEENENEACIQQEAKLIEEADQLRDHGKFDEAINIYLEAK